MFKRASILQYSGGELICADCSASDPTWASINHGVLVCDGCCSVHRSLGRHISHIRSMHSSWPPSQKEMVNVLVQKGANSIWEHALHDSSINLKNKPKKPNPKDKINPNKQDFIIAKYKHLSYVPRLARDKDDYDSRDDINKQLHASVRTSNLETCLRLLSLGADPNYLNSDKGNTPLHVASHAGQSMQVELLVAHGADPCILDRLGHMPDECARIAGHHSLADRLIECQYELSDKLSMFLCGRKPTHTIGEHFLIPKTDRPTTHNTDAHNKLQELSNKLFEELVADVYDEVDRRETDALWLTTQQQQSAVAFLPVNPFLTPLRNQGRQKLATLDASDFHQLLIDILTDTKRRQGLSISNSGDETGTKVPSCDLEMPQHDYDEVAMDKAASLGKQGDLTITVPVNSDADELPYQEPISSPPPLSPDTSYAALVEKYNKRGKEIKALRKIKQRLEAELKQAKAELEQIRSGKNIPNASDSGYAAVTEKDVGDYAEVPSLSPEPDDILSEHSSSPDNRSIPPTSPQKRNSGQMTGQVPTDPYARIDVAKKAYERQKKAELEKRWRLNSADEPQKDELNTCVKKISRNIYALLEAQKSTTEK